MGDAAEDVYASFSWSVATDAGVYDKVLEKFEAHFIPRRNIIHERYLFNRRHQIAGESAETFITALYTLSEHCEFEKMKDPREELIRDHIVLGIRDAELSKKLQTISDLTLAKAVNIVRTYESIEREGQVQRNDTNQESYVDSVDRKQRPKTARTSNKPDEQNRSPSRACFRCGGTNHRRSECPAINAECDRCGSIGHYGKMCRTRRSSRERSSREHTGWRSPAPDRRTQRCGNQRRFGRGIRAVEADSDSSESSFFIGSIKRYSKIHRIEKEWVFSAEVGTKEWQFEIDCGADDTVAPPSLCQKEYPVFQTKKQFHGPGSTPLKVIGMQKLPIVYRGIRSIQNVYFVKGQKVPLLVKPAIKAFDLIHRVNHMQRRPLPEVEFKDRFMGFGAWRTRAYKIELEKQAKPFAIKVPRKVAYPLLEKTKKALQKYVERGIIPA